MVTGGKIKLSNRLWLTRKRLGLKQKQIAYLLGLLNQNQVSRFEHGGRLPTLETALRLEIILQTPLRMLYSELYERLKQELREKIKANPTLRRSYQLGQDTDEYGDLCEYNDMLRSPAPSQIELYRFRMARLARHLLLVNLVVCFVVLNSLCE